MMWQGKRCSSITYEIFFVNFLVIISCPVFVHWNLKTFKNLKPKKKLFFSKNLVFPALIRSEIRGNTCHWVTRSCLHFTLVSHVDRFVGTNYSKALLVSFCHTLTLWQCVVSAAAAAAAAAALILMMMMQLVQCCSGRLMTGQRISSPRPAGRPVSACRSGPLCLGLSPSCLWDAFLCSSCRHAACCIANSQLLW